MKRGVQEWANVVLAFLSWEACGRPARVAHMPADCAVSDAQRSVQQRVLSRVGSLARAGHSVPGRGTLQQMEDEFLRIRTSLETSGWLQEGTYGASATVPQPERGERRGPVTLVAADVDLPRQGCTFDPAPWLLCPIAREAYEDPSSLVLPESECEPPPPSRPMSRHVVSAMCARLDEADMLALVPEADAAEPMVLLAVRKKQDPRTGRWILRLILDRRARNGVERRLEPEGMRQLAQGVSLCEYQLAPKLNLRVDATDLSHYYYQFRVTPARAATNTFGTARPASEFEGLRAASGLDPTARFAPAVSAMAMGDGNGCEFAQSVHLAVLKAAPRGGCCAPRHLLRGAAPVPRDALWEGVVIDDHGSVYAVPATGRAEGGVVGAQAADLRAKALDSYDAAGLAVKDEKAIVGAENATIWGAEVRGRVGRVGVALAKRADLAVLTLELVACGCGSRALVRQLVGCWVAAFLYARPLLSVFDATFRWVAEAGCLEERTERFPRAVRDELMEAALLAPLAETCVRASVAPCIVATDASLFAGGVAVAPMAPAAASELWRWRDRRGAHVPVAWAEPDESLEPVEAPETIFPWASELALGLQFEHVLSYDFKQGGSHINICEHRVRRSWLKSLSRDVSSHGSRRLVLIDSRVVVGSAAKGRSSAGAVNAACRQSMPHLLGPELQEGLLWVASAANPADGPSRHRPVPERTPIAWVEQFGLRGDLAAFDRRLSLCDGGGGGWAPEPLRTSGEAKVPGPRTRRLEVRPDVNLRERARGTPKTICVYDACYAQVAAWALERWAPATHEVEMMDELLAEYGQWGYSNGLAVTRFRDTINAVQSRHLTFKRHLPTAWAALGAWETIEPGTNHHPLPPQALLAAVSLALLWGWRAFAVTLLLAFDGCLRPSDFLQLRRCDIKLPSDLASTEQEAYVVLQTSAGVDGPKTRFRSAHRQQVQLSCPLLVALLERYLAPMSEREFLLAAGGDKRKAAARFRLAFNAVFGELGFSVCDASGLVPASIRAGGITHLFRTTQDLALVRWRGRWDNAESLEHYLQELGAAEVMSSLSVADRARVASLGKLTRKLIREWMVELA